MKARRTKQASAVSAADRDFLGGGGAVSTLAAKWGVSSSTARRRILAAGIDLSGRRRGPRPDWNRRAEIEAAVEFSGGNQAAAARRIGISRVRVGQIMRGER